MDYSLPGSFVHGVSQARIFEWVDISFFVDFPDPGIKPASPTLAGGFFTTRGVYFLIWFSLASVKCIETDVCTHHHHFLILHSEILLEIWPLFKHSSATSPTKITNNTVAKF